MNIAGTKVLLVEDNAPLRRIIARSLSNHGCNVIEAETAEESLRLIESGADCDLLLSDLRLSGTLDGLELAHRLVRLRPNLGVLLQTGAYDSESTPFRLLHKPYTLDQLLEAIATTVNGAKP